MSSRRKEAPGDARRAPHVVDRHGAEGRASDTGLRHEARNTAASTRDVVRAKGKAAVASAEAAAAEMKRELERRIVEARVKARRRR